MDLDGLPLTLLDMAGLRAADGEVEALGVARARERAGSRRTCGCSWLQMTGEAGAAWGRREAGRLVVLAKADLRPAADGPGGFGGDRRRGSRRCWPRSRRARAASLGGAATLVARAAAAGDRAGRRGARARADELGARRRPQVELAAEELRAALRALDFLVGRVDVEAVLDVIFASFCLGK